MRPRAMTRGAAALLVSMTLIGALLGIAEAAGAAFGPAGATTTTTAPPAGAPTTALASPRSAVQPTTSRVFGADRYATAAAVSTATFPAGAPVAYLATGADYPDALTAAA